MSDHLETLRQYNAWRRGDPTLLMIAPEKIGVAIDATIAEVERLLAQLGGKDDISQSLIDENERLRDENERLQARVKRWKGAYGASK